MMSLSIALIFSFCVSHAMQELNDMSGLPQELKVQIIHALTSTSRNLAEIGQEIRNLSVTNKEYYQIINDPKITEYLINALIKKLPGPVLSQQKQLLSEYDKAWLARNKVFAATEIFTPGVFQWLKEQIKNNSYIKTAVEDNIENLLSFASKHSPYSSDKYETYKNMIVRLLKAGANPNAISTHTRAPLFFSAPYDTPEVLEIFLNAGANINAMNSSGETLLDIKIEFSRGLPEDTHFIEFLKAHGAKRASELHENQPRARLLPAVPCTFM